ncbi:MAG: flagellar motor switch protein FliG [Armatimonadota bacterium]
MNAPEIRKAAIVLASLELDAAVNICRHMPEMDAEQIISVMADLGEVDTEEQEEALAAFEQILHRPTGVQASAHAEKLMAEVLGRQSLSQEDERRKTALQRLRALNNAEAGSIRRMLAEETPQMVAVMLSQLTPDKAAQVLKEWPPETRSDLALRVAKMERLAPGAIEAIGDVLSRQTYRMDDEGQANRGLQFVVHLLEDMDRGSSKRLLSELRERDSELAGRVEDRLFTFENVVQLSDQDLQTLLRGLEHATIARALKGIGESVRDRIFANVSERARDILEQEIEFLGPVLVREVEEAQKEFVNLALDLEQAGEITLTTEEAQYIE